MTTVADIWSKTVPTAPGVIHSVSPGVTVHTLTFPDNTSASFGFDTSGSLDAEGSGPATTPSVILGGATEIIQVWCALSITVFTGTQTAARSIILQDGDGGTELARVTVPLLPNHRIEYWLEFNPPLETRSANGLWTVLDAAIGTGAIYCCTGSAIKKTTNFFSGIVTNADTAAAISGATVTIARSGHSDIVLTTDSSGYYASAVIPVAIYDTIVITKTGYDAEATVTNSYPTYTEHVMYPTADTSFSGTVTDSVSTDPIEDATVTISRAGHDDIVLTTAVDGTYESVPLPDDDYDIVVEADDHATDSSNTAVSPDVFDVALDPVAVFTGTITESSGHTPLVGATVTIKRTAHTDIVLMTNASGVYTSAAIYDDAVYDIVVSKTLYTSDSSNTGVAPGTINVELVLV